MRFFRRLSHELLTRLLPDAWADEAVGDLSEEWREWRRRDGRLRAGLRYAARAVGLILYGAADRLRRSPALIAQAGAQAGAQAWPAVRRTARRPLVPVTGALVLGPVLAGAGAFVALAFGAFVEPLPYPDADRLVVVGHAGDRPGDPRQSAGLHLHYRPRVSSASALALFRNDGANVLFPSGARRTPVMRATAETLELLGGEALHGRLLREAEDDDTSPPAVVIARDAWERYFGGDSTVISRPLEVDGTRRIIVGVLSGDPPLPEPRPDLVLSAGLPAAGSPLTALTWSGSLARLAPGASAADLEGELAALLRSAPVESPDGYTTVEGLARDRIEPRVSPLADWRARDVRPVLATGALASILLLGLTVFGVLTLVAAWSSGASELRVRRALGASPLRLRLQSGAEAVAALAGACVLGAAGAAALARILGIALNVPGAADGVAEPRAAAAAAVLGLVVIAAVAALRAKGGDIATLRPGRRRRRSVARPLLLTGQVAAVTVLLAAAVGLGRTAWSLARADLGFDPDGLVTFGVVLPDDPYADRPADALALQRRLSHRLGAQEGVEAAAYGVGVPGSHPGWIRPWELEGLRTPVGSEPAHRYRDVSRSYVEVLGIPVLRGRDFEISDFAGPPETALVNEAFARLHWGSPGMATGRRLRSAGESDWLTVVGVVANTADQGPARDPEPMIYRPLSAAGTDAASLRFVQHALRGRPDVAAVERAARDALGELDPTVPAFSFDTGTGALHRAAERERLAVLLVALASVAGLVAAALGFGGVVLLDIRVRARALGIRKAVGASDGRLRFEALRPVLVPAVAGVVLGLAGVMGGLRVPPALLHDAGPWTSHLAAAAAGIVLVVLASACLGTREVLSVSPASALRED